MFMVCKWKKKQQQKTELCSYKLMRKLFIRAKQDGHEAEQVDMIQVFRAVRLDCMQSCQRAAEKAESRRFISFGDHWTGFAGF